MKAFGRVGLAGVVGLVAGVLLAAAFLGRRESPEPAPTPGPERGQGASSSAASETGLRLEELADALEAERAERLALAQEVAELRARLGGSRAAAPTEPPELSAEGTPAPQFAEGELRSAGLPDYEIERLRERLDQLQLDEAFLRDRAAREGWENPLRIFSELHELQRQVRDDVGAESYDWLLYAAGRNNRVFVSDVIEDSPAGRAGLQRGDMILRYAGQPIFDRQDLVQATSGGTLGASTEIRFLRDGQEQRRFVPRGPLGMHVKAGLHRPGER